MKRVFYLLSFMALIGCQSSIRSGIERQLKEYPESRVQDIYKCFCQDNLGPEHLIPNPETARAYLIEEIEEYCEDLDSLKYIKPTLRYFATGDEGNYIRVDLSVVLDEFMTADEYLDAFVRSANRGTKRTTEQWKAKWAAVERCIRKHYMTIPDADKDLQEIKALMDEDHFIIHHSDTFGQVYNPHYRIIAKDIFESEILPRINKTKKDMNSALELTQEWDKVFPQSDKQAPQFLKEYADFYSTPRGFHPRSGGSTDGWNLIGCQSFLNQPLLCYAHEITNPVLLIHGGMAHSRYFSETAFQKMTGKTVEIPTQQEPGKNFSFVEGNKELYIVQGAVHTDLYDDRAGVIPYDKMEAFFRENLK